jgi:hypothetical protein
MLAGNPRIGRRFIWVVIFVLVILLTTLAELRNKPDPEKKPPLHQSTLTVPHLVLGRLLNHLLLLLDNDGRMIFNSFHCRCDRVLLSRV